MTLGSLTMLGCFHAEMSTRNVWLLTGALVANAGNGLGVIAGGTDRIAVGTSIKRGRTIDSPGRERMLGLYCVAGRVGGPGRARLATP